MSEKQIAELIERLIDKTLADRIQAKNPVTKGINAAFINGKIMGLISILDTFDDPADFVRVYEKYKPIIEADNEVIETLYHKN